MISHEHKTIFVHIPKCGGQSVEQMFVKDLGLTWETRAPLTLRPNPDRTKGPPRLAHLLADEYIRFGYVTEEQFRDYFTFAVVRDPVARVLSTYNYLGVRGPFANFVTEWLPRQFALATIYDMPGHGYPAKYWFVRPQADFLCDAEGGLLVDRLFPLERMDEAEAAIRPLLHRDAKMPHVNASSSRRRAGRKDVTPELASVIATLFARDYALLPYDAPAPLNPEVTERVARMAASGDVPGPEPRRKRRFLTRSKRAMRRLFARG